MMLQGFISSPIQNKFTDFDSLKWIHGTYGNYLLPILAKTDFKLHAFGDLIFDLNVAPFGGETFHSRGCSIWQR